MPMTLAHCISDGVIIDSVEDAGHCYEYCQIFDARVNTRKSSCVAFGPRIQYVTLVNASTE